MNKKKVENFILERLDASRAYYPAEIFEGVEVEVQFGSFGSCLITIDGKYSTISARYVGNYKAIEEKVSYFVSQSYFNLTGRYWEKTHERTAKYILKIYNDDELVNTIIKTDYFEVMKTLATIYIDKERRGTKTRFYGKPNGACRIVQTWNKERWGGSYVLKYEYEFEGVDL